ncbi:hypothetical protein ACIBL6_00250 [Streptomyces sp. NPDC050400]|uniref:hypothetical protein n=1 Tax=Streptomyces sp. NPDC050400 TaxID=3365610 RepID=UPI003793B2CF
MAVVPLDATRGTRPAQEVPRPLRTARPAPPRRSRAGLVLPVLLALLALPLAAAAHHVRPTPYGDHLVRVADRPGGPAPRLRTRGAAVEAYDTVTRWRHTRAGRRPLAVSAAPGQAFALWSDGLVTDTERADGRSVRWHRAIPDAAAWLRTPGARGGAGVLQPLDPGARMLAVVTPQRIAGYRTEDGDLRWVLPAREGCVFEPASFVRRGGVLLVAQPCTDPAIAWSERIIAVDGLGRVVPGRTPLGNGMPRAGLRGGVEKELAPHR